MLVITKNQKIQNRVNICTHTHTPNRYDVFLVIHSSVTTWRLHFKEAEHFNCITIHCHQSKNKNVV